MSPFPLRRPGQPQPLTETAAAWALKAEEGAMSAADEERLSDWLEEPAHAKAFDDALWALDATQRHAASPELMAMREAALAKREEPHTRRFGWAAGIGAGAMAAAVGGLIWVGQPAGPIAGHGAANHVGGSAMSPSSAPVNAGLYRTGIGERSAVVLPDGSVATLDTDSQLRVAYSSAERGVYLLKGQALFEVAHGKRLPFEVYAAGQRITAVGTTFNVRIKGSDVQIAMVEGVVRVRPIAADATAGRPARELTLRAGESLDTAPAEAAVIKPVDTSQVATWRGGLLVFEDESLSDAVAEINRYTGKPIRIADASIGNYRVTGVFQTNDPEHFATAMSEVFPVEVQRDSSGSPVLKAQH
jgi:transmembrane sensor